MSIPKEPRQLMINIMYLVLTALLALNVSAEVFNAFKLVDKGLIKSNKALDDSMEGIPSAIRDGAKTRPSLATYAERIDPIKAVSDELSTYLRGIVDGMIEETGGYVTDSETGVTTDELKAAKDYDITTRTLVTPADPNKTAKGPEIKAKLVAFKEAIMQYIDEEDRPAFEKEVAVQVDDETWKTKGKTSWSQMNFDHMPLQAVAPIFSKYINDVKSTEAAALNYLASKVGAGGTTVVLDKYEVVSAPEKSYIIKGEKYATDVFLSAAAGSDSNTGISYSVNGKRLNAKDGVARFEEIASTTGVKKYTAAASLTDPVSGETKTFKKEFSYEVGERSVAISASKMNVFYIGVDNPVEISAAGVNSNKINPTMGGSGGGTIKKNSDGTYTVRVTKPTLASESATINVAADGLNASKQFRVKRIPDPTPMVGRNKGGGISTGEFKISKGIFPVLEGFDFEAKCEIVGFETIYAAKRKDIETSRNAGWKWNSETAGFIAKAKPGDRFIFEGIKCKCPGDAAPRDIGNMSFGVK